MEKFRVHASVALGHKLIHAAEGDQYIAAHPRSGSTWLRTVLVNLIQPDSNSDPDVFNALVPSVGIRSSLGRIRTMERPRLIMTHSWYRPEVNRGVYVVRDVRDAVLSYYYYMLRRRWLHQEVDITEFVEAYLEGRLGWYWPRDVGSWLIAGKEKLGENLLIVQFEEMKESTVSVVSDVARFLRLEASEQSIARAIDQASLPKMRQIERMRLGTVVSSERSFYRSGIIGGWRDQLPQPCAEAITRVSESVLRIAGYETDV